MDRANVTDNITIRIENDVVIHVHDLPGGQLADLLSAPTVQVAFVAWTIARVAHRSKVAQFRAEECFEGWNGLARQG